MKRSLPILLAGSVLVALIGAGYLMHQRTLVPVPLGQGRELYVKANPESGEDGARLEVLMPAGPGLEAFLAAQSELPLIEKAPSGAWVGHVVSALQQSRHGRRWRITLRAGCPMQDGTPLDARRLATALADQVAARGGEAKVVDASTLDLIFKTRPEGMPDLLAQWRVPGTGPFIRQGHTLGRFDGFLYGRTGIAALTFQTDPALLESLAWAEGLAKGRWAWAVFPGQIAPHDMAKARVSPYEEIRMKDGSVWFLSRRLRRLHPHTQDWPHTRLFGAWKGGMDLPYDPLGM